MRLLGCAGARLRHHVPHIEAVAGIDETMILWWVIGKPDEWYYCVHAGVSRTSTALLFGKQWPNVVFAHFLIITFKNAKAVRRQVPNTTNIGRADDDVDLKESKNPRGMKRRHTGGSENPSPNIARMLPFEDDEEHPIHIGPVEAEPPSSRA